MIISINKSNGNYSITNLSVVEYEAICNLLIAENYRLSVLARMSNQQFKTVIVNDAELMNELARQKQIEVDQLTELLDDPNEIRSIRSKGNFGKNQKLIERMCGVVLQTISESIAPPKKG